MTGINYLRGHDPLPLRDEVALAAGAVPEPAVALVALQPRDHPVVAAPRALRPTSAGAAGAAGARAFPGLPVVALVVEAETI